MRIAFCVDLMTPGGAERVASILCNEFCKKDDTQVDLIMISSCTKESFYEIDDKINLIPLLEGRKKYNFLTKIKLLRKYLKTYKPDVIVSFLPNVNTCVYFANNIKIPHIVSERNNPYIDPKNRLKRFLKEISFRKANGHVYQTTGSQKYYSKFKSVKNKEVIPNPINYNGYVNFNEFDRVEYFVSAGRLEPQKNFKLLIKSFNNVLVYYQGIKLIIFGEGSQRNELKSLCEELNIQDKVIFKGNDEKWIEQLDNKSCFVCSSDYEGMPNALTEALIRGVPCISTDCEIGGPRDIIQDNFNGILVKVNNEKELSNSMLEIIRNHELVLKFNQNNALSNKIYSKEIIADKWYSFILKVVKENEK